MVSQKAMATTVRKVKQENRLRRQNQCIQDEEGINKTVSSSSKQMSMSNNRVNNSSVELTRNLNDDQVKVINNSVIVQQQLQLQQQQKQQKILSGQQQLRMAPLYGSDEQSNQRSSNNTNLQTHSNKFPIEREVILSSSDKNTKIPILHEYKRAGGRVSIAPDAPVKHQAWVQEGNSIQEQRSDDHVQNFQSQETYLSASSTGAVPRIPKCDEERTKSLSRTYHTIKDMISSRFGPSRKDVDPEPEISLNNVTEELRKSSKSIDEDSEIKKKESLYNKSTSPEVSINLQLAKNIYGQQQQYNMYYQSSQNTLQNALPGQLQSPQLQPNLPGQSAQLHVTHLTPQTVHQTQVSSFNQSRADYVLQGSNNNNNIMNNSNNNSSNMSQLQNPPVGKHGLPLQPINSPGQTYQSPQQLLHQSQLHSPRVSHQHIQNLHQRQLIQQMQQQQLTGQQSPFINGISYQQYQQIRQSISRSQIDLPSTSRQGLDVRMSGQQQQQQEIYYHYNQGRPRYPIPPQVYVKHQDNNNQDVEFNKRKESSKSIEKAVSQPQLCFDDDRDRRNEIQIGNNAELILDKFEITVEDKVIEKNDNETSFAKLKCVGGGSGSGQKDLEDEDGNKNLKKNNDKKDNTSETESKFNGQVNDTTNKRIDEISTTPRRIELNYQDGKKDDLEQGMSRLKLQNQGSGSDYDKTGQSSSNVDSGRGSAVYSSGRRPLPDDSNHGQTRDSEWVDIVESELRSILEPRDIPAMAHSTLSESVSSVTPPLPPLSPHGSPRTPRNRYSSSLPYGSKPNYNEYGKSTDKRNFQGSSMKHRAASTTKKEGAKKFSHLFGIETGDITSTTTGLDLDSMLDRSDSDLSTNDARTIRKQLEGLENMYSEVLKLLGGSVKKRRKARGLTSYGSVSSLPTSSVSSRPVTRHHDKRRSHNIIDDRMKKAKDVKSINKRFQRLESHVVTLARSVAHLSSEMRTQHLMIQEMENIRGEISALRTQTNMAMVRSQSQPMIRDSELPALSNPSRVKKLTKFFGTEPPLIRLFLRELGYEKYANAFEKEKVGMVELPYLSEERLQKMGVPLGPRLRILQEARISVCKDPIYVV